MHPAGYTTCQRSANLNKMFQDDSSSKSDEFDDDIVYVDEMEEVFDNSESDPENGQMEADDAETDDAITVFRHHNVTGGQDDVAFVWDTSSGEMIYKCSEHTDTIIFAEFNFDNSYLAVGDMNGFIQVWEMKSKVIVWDFNMGDAAWMKWHNLANVILAGSTTGETYMWKIPSGECKVFQGYGHKNEIGALTPDGKKLVAGYEDGTIRVLDLKGGVVESTIPANTAHSQNIICLECQVDGKLMMSAAQDGRTVISTVSNGKIINVLQKLQDNNTVEIDKIDDEGAESEPRKNWVESIRFCRNLELHLAATGTIEGELFIWDISKQVIRHKITQESGIVKLEWIGNSPLLCTAGLDGIVRFYDARTSQCLKVLYGHSRSILDLNVAKTQNKILTTSDDGTARIFDISVL
ncbi:GSCOCG00010625001-RA-CDS [Cotesia congregata]|nr:GSCOCG00010625001-RA-CDS [Cotesia congregata]